RLIGHARQTLACLLEGDSEKQELVGIVGARPLRTKVVEVGTVRRTATTHACSGLDCLPGCGASHPKGRQAAAFLPTPSVALLSQPLPIPVINVARFSPPAGSTC